MPNKIVKKVNTNNTLSYSGEVTLKVCDGARVLSTKKFHNAGTKYLARFLCLCLSGNYNSADNIRPFKIKIYYNKNKDAETAQNNLENSIPCMGSFMSMDKLPFVNDIVDNTGSKIIGYSTTLHFLIPYTYIQADYVNAIPNQLCLYGMNRKTSADNKKYCASVLLTEINSATGKKEWAPIEVPATSRNNYNLIIEWTMKFELEKAAENDYVDGLDD